MQYMVVGSVLRTHPDGWNSARQTPVFILDSAVQGIVDVDHAKRIAVDMLTDIAMDADQVIVTVTPITEGG